MKQNLAFLKSLFGVLLFASLFTCSPNDESDLANDRYVNKWIYNNMSDYYLWNDKIPSSPNYNVSPDIFFKSICYWYNKDTNPDGDRFSWIQNNYQDLLNYLNGVANDEIGFEYKLYKLSENSAAVLGEILYVKPGTSAEKSEVKRGQVFTEINNTPLTESNYKSVLNGVKGNYTLSLHDYDGEELSEKKVVPLSTVSQYNENPIYFNTVYDYDGKKIAYLVYNFFAGDNNNGTYNYDRQLAQIFNDFKSQNVTSLILDFRYNSGGSVSSAIVLASMIVKNFSDKNIFYTLKCNAKYEAYILKNFNKEYFNQYFTKEIAQTSTPLPNIGENLQQFYILTGDHTASASELIINGLKPYMDITLIGSTTIGKNVGSISLYERNNKKNKWGMQPIVFKTYNKDGQSDFTAGFAPDIENKDMALPKKELGDPEEALLSEAIALITKTSPARAKQQGAERVSYQKSVFSSLENKPWRNIVIVNTLDVEPLVME